MFDNNNNNSVNSMIVDMTKDYNPETRLSQATKAEKKWRTKTKLLEGLKGTKAQNLALILDNQARFLRNRNNITESTAVSDIAGFNKIAFPLVRRVFAQLLANNIVSVQPISWATGLIFYLDFTFNSARVGNGSGASIYGNRTTPVSGKVGGIGANTGTGGFYSYQQLGYAHRVFRLGSTSGTYASLTATSSTITGTLSAFEFVVNSGANVMAAFELFVEASGNAVYETGSASSFRSFPAVDYFSSYSYTANIDRSMTQFLTTTSVRVWANTLLSTASLSGGALSVFGRVDTTLSDASNGASTLLGDFESTSFIPQINLKVLSTFISAETKKLKTVWTPEVAQDLNSYMSLDAEVELTNILSEQIAMEIDREILADLITVASVKGAWSRKIGEYVYVDASGFIQRSSAANVTFTYQAVFANQDEWEQTLSRVINSVSARIHKLNLRKQANWIVTSTEVSTVLQTMDKKFVGTGIGEENEKFTLGIEKIGSLQSQWDIYRDPYFPQELMLMGYKGDNPMECGYVWSPYIPLIVTPTIIDPNNFSPIKGVMTRNAKTAIRPDYYGTIRCLSLNFYGLA